VGSRQNSLGTPPKFFRHGVFKIITAGGNGPWRLRVSGPLAPLARGTLSLANDSSPITIRFEAMFSGCTWGLYAAGIGVLPCGKSHNESRLDYPTASGVFQSRRQSS
jgi:hypothetical protein